MSLLSVRTTHKVLAVHTEKHSRGFTKKKKKLKQTHFRVFACRLLIVAANHTEKMETNDNEVQRGNNNDLLLSFVVQHSSGIQNGCSSLINTTKKAL